MSVPMLAAVRHQRIIQLLAEREYVTIADVRGATGASLATAQRDLARLATTGALARVRGGATRVPVTRRGEARLLAACLTRVRTALERQDLGTVEHALQQALDACARLRRG